MLSVLHSKRFHFGYRGKAAIFERKQTFLPEWEHQENCGIDHFDRFVQILSRYEIKVWKFYVLNKIIKFVKLNWKIGFRLSKNKKTELKPEIKLNNPAPK